MTVHWRLASSQWAGAAGNQAESFIELDAAFEAKRITCPFFRGKYTHAIAHYTDTRSWYHRHGLIHVNRSQRRVYEHHGVLLVYFGLVAEVQIAIYLTNILRSAMDAEWNAYWHAHRENSGLSARTVRVSFMRGMAERISTRLYSMKESQNKGSDNNCRAIVLVKKDIVKKAFDATQRKIRTITRHEGLSDSGAYHAGTIAGDQSNDSKRGTSNTASRNHRANTAACGSVLTLHGETRNK